MNDFQDPLPDKVTPTQLRQFQELMSGLLLCCQERVAYQCERFGLPDAELRCLQLFDGERYLTPGGISRQMSVARSRVTRVLEGLERKNLVRRTPDPGDSRVSLISLTPSGRTKLDEISNFLTAQHSAVLEQFAPEQRQVLVNALGSLKLSMESIRDMML